MARAVGWAEAAWRDLESIAEYFAQDSPGYAAAFVQRVRDRARSLDELAFRGRMVPELGEPAVREVQVESYRLIYEVHESAVYILGVVHGARDLAALWDREERTP